MSYSGDAAEQVVRMSLETGEAAIKLAGAGAKEIAVMLYAILRDQKKTRGRARLESMLRGGRELKVFAVKDGELQKFCQEARKYGVLYCVLKDRDATDGITDIMVRAEDAGKINRIFERFQLSTVDMASVRQDIEKSRADRADSETAASSPESGGKEKDAFLDALFGPANAPEEPQRENPTRARTGSQNQSGPTSERQAPTAQGTSDDERTRAKPSVKTELEEIRKEQRHRAAEHSEQRTAVHKAPRQQSKNRKGRQR